MLNSDMLLELHCGITQLIINVHTAKVFAAVKYFMLVV